MPRTGKLQGATNENMLNAIRAGSSLDYLARVPEATQANLETVLNTLSENTPLWNEFVSALINRIGTIICRNMSWQNPLKKFKKGFQNYGSTVEEIYVGMAKAEEYNADSDYSSEDLWKRRLPDVRSAFHTISRQDKYVVTVKDVELRRAFLAPGGLSDFISKLMESVYTGDEWDEYLLMTKLFSEFDQRRGFFKIRTPDINLATATKAQGEEFVKALRATAGNMAIPNTWYNAAKVNAFSKPSDLHLFITPEGQANIDVNVLASVFNLDKAEIPFHSHLVRQEHLGIEGGVALVVDESFFQVYDTNLQVAEIFNPANLSRNHFLHHHQIVSASPFAQAVLFTTGAPSTITRPASNVTKIADIVVSDINGVNVNDAVTRGMLYDLSVTVTESDAKHRFRHGIRWVVNGNQSSKTRVTQNGALDISPDEANTRVTVGAFAANDPSKTVSKVLNVSGDRVGTWLQ